MPSAEDYNSELENLIKAAALQGYDLYAEVDGSVEVDRYSESFSLDSVALVFSNQEKAKKDKSIELDYIVADESLYFIGMA